MMLKVVVDLVVVVGIHEVVVVDLHEEIMRKERVVVVFVGILEEVEDLEVILMRGVEDHLAVVNHVVVVVQNEVIHVEEDLVEVDHLEVEHPVVEVH